MSHSIRHVVKNPRRGAVNLSKLHDALTQSLPRVREILNSYGNSLGLDGEPVICSETYKNFGPAIGFNTNDEGCEGVSFLFDEQRLNEQSEDAFRFFTKTNHGRVEIPFCEILCTIQAYLRDSGITFLLGGDGLSCDSKSFLKGKISQQEYADNVTRMLCGIVFSEAYENVRTAIRPRPFYFPREGKIESISATMNDFYGDVFKSVSPSAYFLDTDGEMKQIKTNLQQAKLIFEEMKEKMMEAYKTAPKQSFQNLLISTGYRFFEYADIAFYTLDKKGKQTFISEHEPDDVLGTLTRFERLLPEMSLDAAKKEMFRQFPERRAILESEQLRTTASKLDMPRVSSRTTI